MKYLIFITLLSVSWLTKAQDTLDKTLLHAELNFWQANNDSSKFCALLYKVKSYRHSALYQQALTEADRADVYALNNEERAQLKYEKMLNSFLSDDYGYCSALTFDSSEVALMDIQHSCNIEYMTLYSLNETGNWTKCKMQMLKCLNREDSNKKKKITTLPESYNYKSPDKCRHLSAMLPGLGEIYAGYPIKGITSFVLNAGFLTFAGYNFYINYYVTGCVSGLFPILKFYGGGKRLSVILADKHNEKEANKIKKQYSKEIQTLLK